MVDVVNMLPAFFAYNSSLRDGPSKKLEDTIERSALYSYLYARHVLKGPFPACENGLRYSDYGLDYQFRFNRNICPEFKIAEQPLCALSHAIMIGGRFPAGEPAMKKSPRIWIRYNKFLNELNTLKVY